MIKVKTIQKKNPKEPEAPSKFYASAVHESSIDLNGLANAVAERCSLRRADVHGVLIALMDVIPNELSNGRVVSLGDLGSFYVNIKSEGADSKATITPGHVKGAKIVYRPAKELRKKLKMIDVSFAS